MEKTHSHPIEVMRPAGREKTPAWPRNMAKLARRQDSDASDGSKEWTAAMVDLIYLTNKNGI